MAKGNPATIYIRKLDSANSVNSVQRALSGFARWMLVSKSATYLDIPWSKITLERLQEYRHFLITAKKSPDTIATYLSYLKSVIRVAATVTSIHPEHRLPHAVLVEIAQELKPPKRSGQQVNEFIRIDEFKMILNASQDGTTSGKRDSALLHLLYGCGLRRSEVVGLNMDSVVWERQALKVIGKGNKTRYIPMFSDLESTLEEYLFVRGEHEGPLFYRISRADNLVTSSRLTDAGLVNIVKRRCAKAGLSFINLHSFRASFATIHFTIGTDLFTIQNLMGHSSPTTTKRYDIRDEQAGADAMSNFANYVEQN